ncbi:helix-turn-helix domain-containing protein [Paracoccus sp. SCSIO 75233]|uniref:helix-turn-helix domain-containing protein n=1 Tax=Paracoccus sp. SCSIO 75233 TaxID=3017782 RepID=UPI0022F05699|nr:helix-turn-helix transcriptional regulator [Paracoccus sp. SCSIO 75233]WBU52078.1 helix-turn-helix transcriptional regulator [Paracoccus sp. SCSIO 75233]
MNGEQIRAARVLAGMTAQDLAESAGVSYPTVQRLDATRGPISARHDTVEAIRKALESRGIQFLENGQVPAGRGVALKGEGE